jgi:hypothetical protein
MPVTPLWTVTPSNSDDVEYGMHAMIAALLHNQPTSRREEPARHWSTGLCVGECVEHVLRTAK